MSRRQRQFDELMSLCNRGRVGRAIDLAHEHFAQFGVDAAVVELLGGAVALPGVPERFRRSFAELRAMSH